MDEGGDSEARERLALNRDLAVAGTEWRTRIEPELIRCLPPPDNPDAPHPVRFTFRWDAELSNADIQRYVVADFEVIDPRAVSPTVHRCLSSVLGTSLDAPMSEVLAVGHDVHDEIVSLVWGSG